MTIIVSHTGMRTTLSGPVEGAVFFESVVWAWVVTSLVKRWVVVTEPAVESMIFCTPVLLPAIFFPRLQEIASSVAEAKKVAIKDTLHKLEDIQPLTTPVLTVKEEKTNILTFSSGHTGFYCKYSNTCS